MPQAINVEAFENTGKQKGLEIWRIENFEPVPVDPATHGRFFTGDSYIVLSTKESDKGILSWDIHFWLGTQTTQDEAGSAAYLTVKLDDMLSGGAKHHREVQEHESAMFLDYFRGAGIRYEEGGVASGFKNIEMNAPGQKRLFQVKGRKHVRVRQVEVSVDSMNRGDCFILDTGKVIMVYVGPKSKRVEKTKATTAAAQIRDQDHHGRGCMEIFDEYSSLADMAKFFTELGSGSADEVPDDKDDDAEFEDSEQPTMYILAMVEDKMALKFVGVSPFKMETLKPTECFVLDGISAIFVWIGRSAAGENRARAMSLAQELIATKHYPKWTQVERVNQSGESAAFKQFFKNWKDKDSTSVWRLMPYKAPSLEEDFDPATLHRVRVSGGRAIQFMPDAGNGDAEQYRIDKFQLVAVRPEMLGIFFAANSFVVKYHYRDDRGRRGWVVYTWQGRDCAPDEKATSALLALNEAKRLEGDVVQVRVPQCNEPRHFLKIFHGTMIILNGSHAGGIGGLNDAQSYDRNGCRLFRVRGATGDDVRADQRHVKAAVLQSDDAFVLETPERSFIWHGAGTSEPEKLAAREVAARLCPQRDVSSSAFVDDAQLTTRVLKEGAEPDEFWAALGGRATYDTTLDPTEKVYADPRLFRCWVKAGGALQVQEVAKFEQSDLKPINVMVLDGGDEVYTWIGQSAPEVAVKKAEAMALKYVRTEPSERTEETVTFVRVQPGAEPRSFRRLFPHWDDDLWENVYVMFDRDSTAIHVA